MRECCTILSAVCIHSLGSRVSRLSVNPSLRALWGHFWEDLIRFSLTFIWVVLRSSQNGHLRCLWGLGGVNMCAILLWACMIRSWMCVGSWCASGRYCLRCCDVNSFFVLISTPEGPASSWMSWEKWSGTPGGSCICLECPMNVAYSCSVVVYAWCVVGSWFGLVFVSHVVLASGAAWFFGCMDRHAFPSRPMRMSC